jgi:putative redox protein
MKATARRSSGCLRHEVEIRSLRFAAGLPAGEGGHEEMPTPDELLAASLAACSTLTIEAYATRKGWDVGEIVVEVDYAGAQRGSPARCRVVVRLPEHLPEEHRRCLMSVAAKSPVHRTLEGETMFDEHLEASPLNDAGNAQPSRPPAEGNRLLERLLPSSRRPA